MEFKNDDPDQIRQRLRAAEEAYSDWYFEFADDDSEPPEGWEPPEPDYYDDD